MGTLGTFDSFTTARLGIYAAQHGLRVTGNNISNINTAGYTRQRIDQVSFKTGANDRYRSMMDNHVGSGALVTGINQIRDPYLDIRYRNTTSDTTYYDTKLAGLQEIASILDEVGKGITDGDDMSKGDGLLYAQLKDLHDKLLEYSAHPTKDNEILVRGSAASLTSLFNKYADRLEKLHQDYDKDFNDNISLANKVLANIRDLNKSIRECEINGDNALEMRDERNRQIDKLAEYMSIKVEYSMEDVGAGIMVEKLTIYMGDSNPDPKVETDSSILVDGLYCTQLSVPEQKPVLNQYNGLTQEAIDKDPNLAQYAYLKDYLYQKEVPLTADELDGLLADGITPIALKNADGTDKTDADGNQLYLMGTNDAAAEGIITEKNDNYTVQLGKLLDVHDKEWERHSTDWTAVTGGVVGEKAKYSYTVSSQNWDETANPPQTFQIGNNTYTLGQGGFTAAVANDPAQMAAFIVREMNAQGMNPDYVVTANGENIVYTAKNAGLVGGNNGGPAAAPNPNVQNGQNLISLTLGDNSPGVDSVPPTPNPPTVPEAGTTIDPVTGTETTVAYREVNGAWYKITMTTEHTHEVALDDNDLYGELQAQREFLTEEGEFCSDKDRLIDENASIKRGIRYYQQAFDLLAQKFAEAYNGLNQGVMLDENGNEMESVTGTLDELRSLGVNIKVAEKSPGGFGDGYYVDSDGRFVGIHEGTCELDDVGLTVNDTLAEAFTKINDKFPFAPPVDETDEAAVLEAVKGFMKEHGVSADDKDAKLTVKKPIPMGGPLFSNRNDNDDPTGITAANISISHSWSHNAVKLIPKFEVLFGGGIEHSTQNTNADHMVSMIDKALTYDPRELNGSDATGPILFEGSFNDMFSYIMGVQAKDASETNVKLITSSTTLVELDSSREGVSGVDLNDEAMNMMQYQKAMNAAMRLMTAIDESLDRLINNTGVAGR